MTSPNGSGNDNSATVTDNGNGLRLPSFRTYTQMVLSPNGSSVPDGIFNRKPTIPSFHVGVKYASKSGQNVSICKDFVQNMCMLFMNALFYFIVLRI